MNITLRVTVSPDFILSILIVPAVLLINPPCAASASTAFDASAPLFFIVTSA
jgi:hypothetical protein